MRTRGATSCGRRLLMCAAAIVAILMGAACGTPADRRADARRPNPGLNAADTEADEIRQLLAYAIVAAHWETGSGSRRGHNIGAVLVAPDGMPVWWELNANFIEQNPVEHAEARLIKGYFAHRRETGPPLRRLSNYTVYTTLEPCAMCAGMMIMADVERTVYGQTDPRWGRASERLSLDSRTLRPGFAPYPRGLISQASQSSFRTRLETAYRRSGGSGLTEWLDTGEARAIFLDSARALQRFALTDPRNDRLLQAARHLYEESSRNGPG